MSSPPYKLFVDLDTLTPGRTFAIYQGADDFLVCNVSKRKNDVVTFEVVNGQWSGTLCARTGLMLTDGKSDPVTGGAVVAYTGNFPANLRFANYNEVVDFVRQVLTAHDSPSPSFG